MLNFDNIHNFVQDRQEREAEANRESAIITGILVSGYLLDRMARNARRQERLQQYYRECEIYDRAMSIWRRHSYVEVRPGMYVPAPRPVEPVPPNFAAEDAHRRAVRIKIALVLAALIALWLTIASIVNGPL